MIEEMPLGDRWQRIGIGRHAGVAIPLFSLRTEQSCGVGEFLDLPLLFEWCSRVGMDVVQLLPLNDSGDDPSPYSGVSAFALNPIYISLSALPHAKGLAPFRRKNKNQRLNYQAIRAMKLDWLQDYFEQWGEGDLASEEYATWCDEEEWLEGYCRFVETGSEPLGFISWLQFICHKQLAAVADEARGRSILLMGDLPILIGRGSADVHHHPQLFDLRFSAGAPPDQYSSRGQNWGLPIYNWEAHFTSDFAWWKRRLRLAERYFDLYRLDHIVGFFRFWSIPTGKSGRKGAFRPSKSAEQMELGEKILRHLTSLTPMLPIGEDLGSVPDRVREVMLEIGIPGTKVLRWERRWKKKGHPCIPIRNYPQASLATVSTHDAEPLTLWWKRNKNSATYAHQNGWPYIQPLSKEVLMAMLRQSHTAPSLFTVNPLGEYLALFPELVWDRPADERINVPGTVSRRNWSYRIRPTLEELLGHEPLQEAVRGLIQ